VVACRRLLTPKGAFITIYMGAAFSGTGVAMTTKLTFSDRGLPNPLFENKAR